MTRTPIDKAALIAALVQRLEADIEAIRDAQQRTQAGLTHEESRAEHAKDTRATESSYLARGLAERLARLHEAAARVTAMRPRDFTEDDPIALGALVELEGEQGEMWYFVAPEGGGTRLPMSAREVLVVTPRSPVGRALIGESVDDEVVIDTPRGRHVLTVLEVW